MNETQQEKYEECEREINRRIAEHENYARPVPYRIQPEGGRD